jgi:predicted amidophosphoribosyltransferase
MDQSSNQSAPPQNQRSAAHRDMMFCHECADEWYRDEQGLTCPECGSDFTEIVSLCLCTLLLARQGRDEVDYKTVDAFSGHMC